MPRTWHGAGRPLGHSPAMKGLTTSQRGASRMTAGDKRETQSARERLDQAKTTLAAAVAQCDAARQNHSSLGQQLRELEANGDNLPPDKAAISKYLQELEVCRAEVRIADRVLQQANAAVEAAQAAREDAEWRCEYDLLERRADTVSEALEKYHHHANAIVEMLAAAQIVGNQLAMFRIRAARCGRTCEVNIRDPSWKTRPLWRTVLCDLSDGQAVAA